MKTVLICWNDDSLDYVNKIIKAQVEGLDLDYKVEEIFTNFVSLKNYVSEQEKQGNKSWKNIHAIIVLCELKWSDDDKANHKYSEMNGIRLVQNYIRDEKSIKLPILFLSMLPKEYLLELECQLDKDIISTPPLQHYFSDILSPERFDKLKDMEPLTDAELEYSLLFCSPNLRLAKYKHDIKYYDEIESLKKLVIKIEDIFLRNRNLESLIEELTEIKNTINLADKSKITTLQDDIEALCSNAEKVLYDSDLPTETFSQETEFGEIKILYLEDYPNEHNVKKFRERAEAQGLRIEIAETKEELDEKIKNDKKCMYPIVICDIEVWEHPDNENRKLNCLGFNCVKELVSKYPDGRKYYLLSNCSKRLHSKIIDDLRPLSIPLYSKDSKLSSLKVDGFLNELKRTAQEFVRQSVFDRLYNFLKEDVNFESIKRRIDEEADCLIAKHIEFFTNNKSAISEKCKGNTLDERNSNKNKIINHYFLQNINYIRENIKNFGVEFNSQDTHTLSEDIKEKFIKKLILRRLAIFIAKHSAETVWKNYPLLNKKASIEESDELELKKSFNQMMITQLHFVDGKDNPYLRRILYLNFKTPLLDVLKPEEFTFFQQDKYKTHIPNLIDWKNKEVNP